MVPHAINTNTTATPPISVAGSISETLGGSISLIKSNPFGVLADPHTLKGNSYTSAGAVVSQALYSVSSKVFSYEAAGSDVLLDAYLELWSQNYKRPNAFGIVPIINHLEVRSGAASAILGYFSRNGTSGQPISVLMGADALTYMKPTLTGRSADRLPLSLNVSAIDYDFASESLVSNYSKTVNVARSLGYPIFTPVDARNGPEIQHLTVLNHYLAFLTGSPSINLFDGPEFIKLFTKFENLLSVEDLGKLYEELLANSNTRLSCLEKSIESSFEVLNRLAGTSYSFFDYVGDENPDTVFVTYGSHQTTELTSAIQKMNGSKVGLIKIRVRLPFHQEYFVKAIPATTKKLVILDESSNLSLRADVASALFVNNRYYNYSLDEFSYPLNFNWTPITIAKIFSEYLKGFNPDSILSQPKEAIDSQINANSSPEGKFIFWGKDNGLFLDVAERLSLSLSLDNSKVIGFRNKYDNSVAGGLLQSQIISSLQSPPSASIDSADVVFVEDLLITDNYDVLATAKPGAVILYINQKPITSSVEEDIVPKIPAGFKRGLAENHNRLIAIDFSALKDIDEANDSTKGFSGSFLIQLAFWRASYPELGNFIVNKLLQANGNDFELLAAVLDKFIQLVDEKKALKEIKVLPEWVDIEEVPEVEKDEKKESSQDDIESEPESKELPFFPTENSFFPNPRNEGIEPEETLQGGYKDLATKFTFPEAFEIKEELRPELPVENFIVKVQENKRLTPTEYSRNIFHIEFDITGTGLTYDIGEALGIHGRNNSEEVEKFLKFYNVDGDSLIEVSHRDDASILEIRSVRQTLSESIDFLGKPPKRFYESLAEYASDEGEKKHLESLASAEGAAELKKRQEVDFLTYVDILEEFKSARPSFADLVKIIAPLKRREYSIASSQKLHPNSVHLLIVVVDWIDPKGKVRYGHCSKYLSDLKVGDELVVSVKPSVMKLPPLTTQPIVMSGLGTGLAPFKAFIEEKIWQKQQGHEIGEIYLYMGSRHKKEEYLYGELWEAYKDSGVLTHIGAAFSRDQPEKIYIQDRIRETIEELTEAIVTKNGSFYLCGPTWPVPDITACLEDIVTNGSKKLGLDVKDIARAVEDMKEAGRYILEVY
ncbi:uncharacterized protein PRCAT00005339001 [Priceomyces carsonii]|uniref:uncharacterized protein n=1 Tax=Priceomyces carsonii TaxID=28549 RepID=UPI002EDA30B3|nr:unnamed protein product [Priceomyces carsonii]